VTGRPGIMGMAQSAGARSAPAGYCTLLCTHEPEDRGREGASWVVHFIAEKRVSPCATAKAFRRARFAPVSAGR
jgi:hypothetical protein